MMRLRFVILVGAFAAGLGLIVFETRLVSAQREQARFLARQVADTTRHLAALRQQRDGVARDLALAEQQLLRLPPITLAVERPTPVARDSTAEAWLARLQQLRALMAANPPQAIPEMQLLTDEDWMRVAQRAAFDTDAQRREALAELRRTSKAKFIPGLASAAQKWTLANGTDKTPASIADLAAHFEPPVDPAILRRYEIVAVSRSSSRANWRAQESAAIDEDYDTRYSVEANGSHGWSGGGPLTWNAEYSDRVQRAYRTYANSNQGARAPGFSAIVPYIDPPLPPAIVEKLLKAERERQK
ncbi:MAG: hypothetical protein HZA93_20500 [Verrucomicrobia bacterium]|nr:hypothetical protein [Verrucomicrobiota bacterium]